MQRSSRGGLVLVALLWAGAATAAGITPPDSEILSVPAGTPVTVSGAMLQANGSGIAHRIRLSSDENFAVTGLSAVSAVVPEPGTALLLSGALVAAFGVRRRIRTGRQTPPFEPPLTR